MKQTPVILALLALSACTSSWDMQGIDPKDYYAEHPIKNKVEPRIHTVMVHFMPGAAKLPADEMDRLRSDLHGISPMAADAVIIQLSSDGMRNAARREHLVKFMHSLGYDKQGIRFERGEHMAHDDASIDISYAVVVAPDCPDWRMSPVTSYSNTHQGNFRCAQEVNLGQMVADPHDLVRGTGDVQPDTIRSTAVIENYHAGKDASTAGSSGATSSATPVSGAGEATSP